MPVSPEQRAEIERMERKRRLNSYYPLVGNSVCPVYDPKLVEKSPSLDERIC